MSQTERKPPPLAAYDGEPVPAPDWFKRELDTPFEAGRASHEGDEIAWKAWGERGAPAIILVHGGTAHKGWWDAMGPFLARQGRRVIAPDLLGMGESSWREAYTLENHGAAILAAGEHAGAYEAGLPVLVGHSFGGFVTLKTVTEMGDRLKAAIIVDSPIRKPDNQRTGSPPRRGGRTYKDLQTALARFRLLPEQECENMWLVDHIARGSLKQTDEGFTWWFDPDLWAKLTYERRDPEKAAASLKCPLAFIRGEDSVLMHEETWDYMQATFTQSPFVSVPSAQHHLLLDQPVATAAAIDALVKAWADD